MQITKDYLVFDADDPMEKGDTLKFSIFSPFSKFKASPLLEKGLKCVSLIDDGDLEE